MTNLSNFDDVQILARTAYGENRGGGIEGMQSVLNVIMNRANKSGWWGQTPRDVCLKPSQFSCWLPNDPNFIVIISDAINSSFFAAALNMAALALSGKLPDMTEGATYYFAESMPHWPHWAIGHKPCAEIEKQLFFNDIE